MRRSFGYPDRYQRDHPSSRESRSQQTEPLGGRVGHRGDAQASGDRTTGNGSAMIAADANEDDSIDVADIVAMQKVIWPK